MLVNKRDLMKNTGIKCYSTLNKVLKLEGAPKPIIGKLYNLQQFVKFIDSFGTIKELILDADHYDNLIAERIGNRGKCENEIPAN